jgi:DNA-binding LytR/AlgR family response regulator
MAQERHVSAPGARVLLHVARDRWRGVDPEDVYFLEAVGETTLVRLRSAHRVRDVRALGDLAKALPGLVRVHRNHAVNMRHVLEVRRRSASKGWEVKLEPPVNRVLPVGATYLARLWAAFGAKRTRARR